MAVTAPVVPLSLQEWRETDILKIKLRTTWDPLLAWFKSQGLTLFTTEFVHAMAPNQVSRNPEGIGYASWKGSIPSDYEHTKAIHCFARDSSGHDVLIRLIKKGEDGREELDILRHVCTGHDAFLGENHCLPMLRLLSVGDMTFGVFPALAEGFDNPWFVDVGEILNAVIQLLEGLQYLHRNLIAHRDIGAENILINFVGGPRPQSHGNSFRRAFPIRYYYIDFELSVRFSPDSRPEDRVVSGIPILRRGYDHPDDYGRDLAPEIIGDSPHDPFKTDIYQLGMMFLENFKHLRDIVPQLIEIFHSMTQHDPIQRPAARQLLTAVRNYEASITREHLRQSAGLEPVVPGSSDSERDRRFKAMLERKAARKQAKVLEDALTEGLLTASNVSSPAEDGLSAASSVSASEIDPHIPIYSNAPGPDPANHHAAPPRMKSGLTSVPEDHKPNTTTRSFSATRTAACLILHLSLSFVFWCIILGPFQIPSSLCAITYPSLAQKHRTDH